MEKGIFLHEKYKGNQKETSSFEQISIGFSTLDLITLFYVVSLKCFKIWKKNEFLSNPGFISKLKQSF